MQKPFTLTDAMMKEIENETTAGVTADVQDTHDAAGNWAGKTGLRRRPLSVQDFTGASSGPEHDMAMDKEGATEAVGPLPTDDPINPAHYRSHPSGIECIEVTRHMNFNVGNAIKYLWRYMDKGDPVENLKKAQWYLDDEIRRLGGQR